MKSLQELRAIRDKMRSSVMTREGTEGKTKILVGMGTCGISAGRREVLKAFTDEIYARDIHDAVVSQTGCIGICRYEPVAEVVEGNKKTTYVKLDAEKVKRIVVEHIIGKNPVVEFTIGAVK